MRLDEIHKKSKFKRENWDYWCVFDDLGDIMSEDYQYYILLKSSDEEAEDWIELWNGTTIER